MMIVKLKVAMPVATMHALVAMRTGIEHWAMLRACVLRLLLLVHSRRTPNYDCMSHMINLRFGSLH